MSKKSSTKDIQIKLEKQIQIRAYQIYQDRPQGKGDAISDWLQAENEIKPKKRSRKTNQ